MPPCTAAWSERISAALDGEATPAEVAALHDHLQACSPCADAAAAYARIGQGLRRARDEAVPARVLARAEALARAHAPPTPPWWRRRPAQVAAAVAALLVATSLPLVPGGLDDTLAHEVAQHHYRGFTRDRPVELASSDPVEVARWLGDAAGYPVDVPALDGAVLLGGRLCRLGGVTTATAVYRRGEEALTLFLPAEGSPAAEAAARYAGPEARCTDGPLGETICVAAGASATSLVVAELPAGELRALLWGAHPAR